MTTAPGHRPHDRHGWLEARVRRHATDHPDEPAVISPHGTLTWAELDRGADRFAGLLQRRGVRPGDRVGWLGVNGPAYPQVLIGAQRRRVALVGLNRRLPAAELAACALATGPALVVDDDGLLDGGIDVGSWAATPAGAVLDGEPDDIAMLFFTSGSTGSPKAVALRRGPNEAFIAEPGWLHIGPADRLLIVPPVFHLAGATWAQYALFHRATQVYLPDAAPATIVDALAGDRITHALMVPTLLRTVVDHLGPQPVDLPHLREIAYGAAPIPPDLLRTALDRLRCSFHQVYGLSEAGGTVCGLGAQDHRPDDPHLNSVGTPIAGAAVRIVDPVSGDELPAGTVGEIVVRTPFVMAGYWDRPDLTAGVLRGGWLHTRDAGRLDEHGYLFVVGRLDDMLITGGENVQPVEVEAVLSGMPGVADCAVFGLPDRLWGDRVCAAVVRSDDALTEDDVIAWCRGRLAHHQAPKQVFFADQLPRNAVGKIMRHELERHFDRQGSA